MTEASQQDTQRNINVVILYDSDISLLHVSLPQYAHIVFIQTVLVILIVDTITLFLACCLWCEGPLTPHMVEQKQPNQTGKRACNIDTWILQYFVFLMAYMTNFTQTPLTNL